jgi:peptide deformylase
VPNIYGKVPRYSKVKVKALGLDGKEFRVTADGFLARVFQHEIDHLNGILFFERLSFFEKLRVKRNLDKE